MLPYIRRYLFSRMRVVSIANFLEIYVLEWRIKQEKKITGHLYIKRHLLPKNNLHIITEFSLQRVAQVDASLTSKHYRRRPLVQWGFDIPCKIEEIMQYCKDTKNVLNSYIQSQRMKKFYVLSFIRLLQKKHQRFLLLKPPEEIGPHRNRRKWSLQTLELFLTKTNKQKKM